MSLNSQCVPPQKHASFCWTEIQGSRDRVRMRARGCACICAVQGENSPICSHSVDMAACKSIIRQKFDWISTPFPIALTLHFSLCDFLRRQILFSFSYIALLFLNRTVILMDGLASFSFLSFNSRAFNASFNLERAHHCTDSR